MLNRAPNTVLGENTGPSTTRYANMGKLTQRLSIYAKAQLHRFRANDLGQLQLRPSLKRTRYFHDGRQPLLFKSYMNPLTLVDIHTLANKIVISTTILKLHAEFEAGNSTDTLEVPVNSNMRFFTHILQCILIGAASAWLIFVIFKFHGVIQIPTFVAVDAGKLPISTGRGNSQLVTLWDDEAYTTAAHTYISSVYHLPDQLELRKLPSKLVILWQFLVQLCHITAVDIGSSVLPLGMSVPDAAATARLVVESDSYHQYDANGMLIIWGQIISLAILTIGARGVGPRFRPDQLSELTGKDLVIFLLGMLILMVTLIN